MLDITTTSVTMKNKEGRATAVIDTELDLGSAHCPEITYNGCLSKFQLNAKIINDDEM